MREENFWCKKPRYSEVRVIARRVIARYDCNLDFFMMKIEDLKLANSRNLNAILSKFISPLLQK